VSYSGVQGREWSTYCHGEGWHGEAGEECNGYAYTTWPCQACCQENERRNSAGFVEAEEIKVKEMKEFPVTITAYRGNKEVKVSGVREDSVKANTDREGNVFLSFEFKDDPDRIGYIPCVDWYTTELES
jgi:hypothetical protein